MELKRADRPTDSLALEELDGLDEVVRLLREGREDLLRDWIERVRVNRAVAAGQGLSDPVLLDHVPQLFDALLERLEMNRPRAEAEQLAAIHGFSRRLSGYDVVETVIELLMFRRAIWAYLCGVDAPVAAAFVVMERIDGMLDRAVITSLEAFLDPAAKMLLRHAEEMMASGSERAPEGPGSDRSGGPA